MVVTSEECNNQGLPKRRLRFGDLEKMNVQVSEDSDIE